MPIHVDDPTLVGDVLLYRRIPPKGDRVVWEDDGTPTPTSQNFKDRRNDELSLFIAVETTPQTILAGLDGFGVVSLKAGQIREICADDDGQSVVIICRDDEEPANGHVLVVGRITNGMAKRLKDVAEWVPGYWPIRLHGDDD
jgi:hypothetical protein